MSGRLNDRLLPANVTLLQPGSQYYRLADALSAIQIQATQAATTTVTTKSQVETLRGQLQTLQTQLDALHARLAAAGIP